MSTNCNTTTPIRDALIWINFNFNLVGIVREFTFPRKSRGSDYFSLLRIVEEFCTDEEFSVHIFTARLEDLPHVKSYKDYIVLHNVKIKEYKGEPCASFDKRYSSFALFNETSFVNFNPYQSYQGFCLQQSDIGVMTRTRNFFATFPSSVGNTSCLKSLKDIKPKTSFDLVFKVLHIEEVSRNVWMLFMWDGNDTLALGLDI